MKAFLEITIEAHVKQWVHNSITCVWPWGPSRVTTSSSWVGMRRIARVAIPVIKVKREGHMITKETGGGEADQIFNVR